MEAIIQQVDVEKLTSIFDIPQEMRNSVVEVTIRPIKKEAQNSTLEKIVQFRKKYNHEVFVEHLKKQAAEGHVFDFDVQKVIDGTETEDDMQTRYRMEKQAWGNYIQERAQGEKA